MAKIAFRGPDRLRVVADLEDLDLFRVVNADRPSGRASNYERGARPRKIERFFAVVHMSISTFTTVDAESRPPRTLRRFRVWAPRPEAQAGPRSGPRSRPEYRVTLHIPRGFTTVGLTSLRGRSAVRTRQVRIRARA